MVADTYSARLGLLEMGTGNQNNSWGTSFNASVTEVVDRAIAGSINRVVTGGTLDLSGSPPPAAMRQDIDLMQVITGTLTSNQTIIVPNLTKTWYFFNGTTGAFQLFVQISGGSTVQIPAGAGKFLLSTNSGVLLRLDRDEIGKFTHSGRTAVAAGELACNGASLLRTDYPDLFNAIGTTWGAADGTHFTLPLLTDTGRFLRSSTGSLTVGTYQSSQNLSHTHTQATGTISGTTDNPGNHTHVNTLTDLGHSHNYSQPTSYNFVSGGGSGAVGTPSSTGTTGNNNSTPMSITNAAAGAHTHVVSGSATVTLNSSGGTEARPESAVVLICIKY